MTHQFTKEMLDIAIKSAYEEGRNDGQMLILSNKSADDYPYSNSFSAEFVESIFKQEADNA